MGPLLTCITWIVVFYISTIKFAYGWIPGDNTVTTGFSVDRQDRNDVVSFWQNVYQASEGYETRVNWNGGNSDPGTTTAAFKNDVQRRINFYRAMAGMTANIKINTTSNVVINSLTPSQAQPPASTTKQTAAQAAAFMISKNTAEFLDGGGVINGIHNPHNPPLSWSNDGSIARNGAFYSNLTCGLYGPTAVDAYISEGIPGVGGTANSNVGHRRMILYSRLDELATGDVPPHNSYSAANALYVTGNEIPAPTSQFVTWPSAGFFPAPLNSKYWSVSYPNADFSSATVNMSHINAANINTVIVSHSENGGDNTLVWEPSEQDLLDAESADQTYLITISNILINGAAHSYNYSVTIINPDRLEGNFELEGSLSPPDTEAFYDFTPMPHADEYQFDVASLNTSPWSEGAEDNDPNLITDNTDSGYSLRDNFFFYDSAFWDTGGKAFRLAFYDAPRTEQSFVVDRPIIPNQGATLSFRIKRGYMLIEDLLNIQYSIDGGGSWITIAYFPKVTMTEPLI